jgi:hypothetical protein
MRRRYAENSSGPQKVGVNEDEVGKSRIIRGIAGREGIVMGSEGGENIGVSMETIGVSRKTIGVSRKTIGVSRETEKYVGAY